MIWNSNNPAFQETLISTMLSEMQIW
jgi:hypothetical protein